MTPDDPGGTSTTLFEGFPAAALDFFDDLEVDNSKTYWETHREIYTHQVRAPMERLVAELEPGFGTAKVFRPYKDQRFAKNRQRPYKEQVSAVLRRDGAAAARYVQLAASGLLAGGGLYGSGRDQVLRLREAVADDRRGAALARLLADLAGQGFALRPPELVRVPRGHEPDHPRASLLRHKNLAVMRSWPPTEPWLHTRQARDVVVEAWTALEPLNTWIDTHVGASAEPPNRR